MKTLIVVPARNDAATIAQVVGEARQWAPVVVIDDGSTDGTVTVARAAGAEVISHPRRLGRGQALRTAIATARARGASVMLTLDAGGDHDPGAIAAVLNVVGEEPRAIAIASRFHDASPAARDHRNATRVVSFFADWIGELAVRDTQSGLRAYPLALFDDLSIRHGGFVFDIEVLLAATSRGWLIVEIEAKSRANRPARPQAAVDGVAVVAYLTRRIAMRAVSEAWAALCEIASVVSRERRRARHRSMLDAATSYGVSPGPWALALGLAALRHAIDRVTSWWRNPRARRDAVAMRAVAMMPLVVGAATLQWLGGRWLPDIVSPLVERYVSPPLLDANAALGAERRGPADPRASVDERMAGEPVPQS